jgi:hypothetical protein
VKHLFNNWIAIIMALFGIAIIAPISANAETETQRRIRYGIETEAEVTHFDISAYNVVSQSNYAVSEIVDMNGATAKLGLPEGPGRYRPHAYLASNLEYKDLTYYMGIFNCYKNAVKLKGGTTRVDFPMGVIYHRELLFDIQVNKELNYPEVWVEGNLGWGVGDLWKGHVYKPWNKVGTDDDGCVIVVWQDHGGWRIPINGDFTRYAGVHVLTEDTMDTSLTQPVFLEGVAYPEEASWVEEDIITVGDYTWSEEHGGSVVECEIDLEVGQTVEVIASFSAWYENEWSDWSGYEDYHIISVDVSTQNFVIPMEDEYIRDRTSIRFAINIDGTWMQQWSNKHWYDDKDDDDDYDLELEGGEGEREMRPGQHFKINGLTIEFIDVDEDGLSLFKVIVDDDDIDFYPVGEGYEAAFPKDVHIQVEWVDFDEDIEDREIEVEAWIEDDWRTESEGTSAGGGGGGTVETVEEVAIEEPR